MKLAAAQSLVAWLWGQHPEIVYALDRQMPRTLGQCFSCDLDLLTPSVSCDTSFLTSLSCASISVDPTSLDIGDCSLNIQTLSESDLTTVPTCALNISGGCDTSLVCSTSVGSTNATTSNSLSNTASWLAAGSAGLTALAKVAASYFQAQAAQSAAAAAQAKVAAAVLAAQTSRAVTGQTALPVAYIANGTGTTTPVISTTGGLVPLTNSILAGLTPSSIEVFLAEYGTWLLIGGAAAFLAYAATRRRTT
jgi:hypothetical protein